MFIAVGNERFVFVYVFYRKFIYFLKYQQTSLVTEFLIKKIFL